MAKIKKIDLVKKQPNLKKIQDKREKLKKTLKKVDKKILNPTSDYSEKMKFSIKKNSLNHNPLFIKFSNWKGDRYSIDKFLDSLIENFEYQKDIDIVINKKNNLNDFDLNNLTSFQNVLNNYLQESINYRNVSDKFLAWLSNSFKYIEENKEYYRDDEKRTISILDEKGRWFESIICYNFIMTFNYFGIEILKKCPSCSNFFCHKGIYAKYCSEGCKENLKKI
jgi:hypothetical protein